MRVPSVVAAQPDALWRELARISGGVAALVALARAALVCFDDPAAGGGC